MAAKVASPHVALPGDEMTGQKAGGEGDGHLGLSPAVRKTYAAALAEADKTGFPLWAAFIVPPVVLPIFVTSEAWMLGLWAVAVLGSIGAHFDDKKAAGDRLAKHLARPDDDLQQAYGEWKTNQSKQTYIILAVVFFAACWLLFTERGQANLNEIIDGIKQALERNR